jgi:Tfp pilus assembly protein PilX
MQYSSKAFLNRRASPRIARKARERGVILIITLIMLVVTSSIAALAIKGTSSTEAIANNSRTQGMAMQIAEAALRYCVVGVSNTHEVLQGRPGELSPNNHAWAILPAPVGGATPAWADITGWQGNTIASTVVPLNTLDNQGSLAPVADAAGNPGSFTDSYRRPPDCIAQDAVNPAGIRIVNVVARGFGPEVAMNNGNPGEIPIGTEVFLHSAVRLP